MYIHISETHLKKICPPKRLNIGLSKYLQSSQKDLRSKPLFPIYLHISATLFNKICPLKQLNVNLFKTSLNGTSTRMLKKEKKKCATCDM